MTNYGQGWMVEESRKEPQLSINGWERERSYSIQEEGHSPIPQQDPKPQMPADGINIH